jgi:hypothetical protein
LGDGLCGGSCQAPRWRRNDQVNALTGDGTLALKGGYLISGTSGGSFTYGGVASGVSSIITGRSVARGDKKLEQQTLGGTKRQRRDHRRRRRQDDRVHPACVRPVGLTGIFDINPAQLGGVSGDGNSLLLAVHLPGDRRNAWLLHPIQPKAQEPVAQGSNGAYTTPSAIGFRF